MCSKQFIFAGSEQVHPHLANQWHLIGIWKAGGMPLQIKEIKGSNTKNNRIWRKAQSWAAAFCRKKCYWYIHGYDPAHIFSKTMKRGGTLEGKVNSSIEIFSGFKNEKGCFW